MKRLRQERAKRASDQRGDTLIELLMAVMILGIVVTGLLGGMGVLITGFGLHRRQATLGAVTHAFAETARQTVEAGPNFTSCDPDAASHYNTQVQNPYQFVLSGGFSPAAQANATIVGVDYWFPTSGTFESSCNDLPGNPVDRRVQRLSMVVESTDNMGVVDGRDTERVQVVVRQP